MAQGNRVSTGARVLLQGELAVGNATVRLTTTNTACSQIIFSAPTARHTKGAANTNPVLIGTGSATATNISGAMYLATNAGSIVTLPIDNAADVYCTGFSAGDVVEYIVFG